MTETNQDRPTYDDCLIVDHASSQNDASQLDHHLPKADGDLLVGAAAIARWLYGDAKQRRKVYYRAERGDIPHFHMGGTICSTRSALKRMMDRNLLCAVKALEAA